VRAALLAAAALVLTGCATTSNLNRCSYGEARRTLYTSTITAADAWVASGRTLSREAALGRQAAAVALSVLDATCPPGA